MDLSLLLNSPVEEEEAENLPPFELLPFPSTRVC